MTLNVGCDSEPEEQQSHYPLRIGPATMQAELALDPATQQKGLMYRESLGVNEGMLFVSESPRPHSFWMRNTSIPLDIGFFSADGILREVYPLFPRVEEPVQSRRDDIVFALETNRGWYKENGVRVGDTLDLEMVRKAMRAMTMGR